MYGVPVWALASTTNSMTSNLIGQGKPNDVIPLVRKIAVMSLAFAAVFAFIILVIPSAALSIFTTDKDLIAASISTLPSILLAILLFSVSILTIFAVSGSGATRVSFYVEVTCIAVYLTYIYFTAIKFHCSLPIIWLSESVYWIIAFTLCSLYLVKGNWRLKKV
jgi:Na+-driven multidrug efflux pump